MSTRLRGMGGGWVKIDARRGVAIHRGTEDVPRDGRYHVIVDGEIIFSTRVETAALIEYEERREERKSRGQEQLRREREAADIRAHRSDSWSSKSSRDQRKGGRGIGRR